jgi:hypothetical protein
MDIDNNTTRRAFNMIAEMKKQGWGLNDIVNNGYLEKELSGLADDIIKSEIHPTYNQRSRPFFTPIIDEVLTNMNRDLLRNGPAPTTKKENDEQIPVILMGSNVRVERII